MLSKSLSRKKLHQVSPSQPPPTEEKMSNCPRCGKPVYFGKCIRELKKEMGEGERWKKKGGGVRERGRGRGGGRKGGGIEGGREGEGGMRVGVREICEEKIKFE